MNYPRKLTIFFAENKLDFTIRTTDDLANMVSTIRYHITNSTNTPVIKVIWNETYKNFTLKLEQDYIQFESFYKTNLKL